ncbi:tRNA (adenosine(37)-N6)-dimethylallyltransferase MiaA [Asticcacaulis sp. AC402]|uniref:tRNA (adenosine(37)-N6)-dimethylallyltransferase MiaA n=1 Tax=Asticcacaulis sp. AC402 TaxID=1282361 RepID=UPI0003C3CE33|nr:tRNA (adenosine(37)-N6)-dimethylallyltransferase MiaA [Asticcacaulis sp. AC402]ESQ75135.1 tRNA delta(2)-isopentenylpyrophosphate transferase [Asticcacaulis sp. AC402]
MPKTDMPTDVPILLLAGPTASGKSARALAWAQETGGVILNADSMQLYSDVPILTARPTATDMTQAEHVLYGHLGPQVLWSAGEWLRAARPYLDAALNGGAPVCVVGGTGLYFNSLVFGLADIPPIGELARTTARDTYDVLGETAFRDLLRRHDPKAEHRISANDRQRLARAYEVFLHTGTPLSDWQDRTKPALPKTSWKMEILHPDREELYARCDARLQIMLDQGALDEVRDLTRQGLREDWPIMRVLGLREFAAHLKGEMTLDAALAQAQQMTRNYAKRQGTWFRNQFPDQALQP